MIEVPSLNLQKILRGGGDASNEGQTTVLEFTVPTPHGEEITVLPLVGAAEWRAIASHVGANEYWLAGRVRATLMLECGRCLDPVEQTLEAQVESLLRFDASIKVPTRTLTEDDEEVILFGDPNIDLTALLAEALSLEIPTTVRCRHNCKGLCSACGANLNGVEACVKSLVECPVFGEKAKKPSNPFAALKDLFKDE